MKLKNKGFGSVQIIVLIGIALLVGAVGWFVWDRRHKPVVKETVSPVTNYAECLAKGGPQPAIYPGQCTYNGVTYTDPTAKPVEPPVVKNETDDWLFYKDPSGHYSLKIPDGWKLKELNGNLYGMGADKIVYQKGVKATVEKTEFGWDGGVPFTLYYPGSYADQIVRSGTEQSTVKSADGYVAHRYKYVQTEASDGPGYQKGAVVYNYYFDADGKYIQVSHVVNPGDSEQLVMVEKLISTLSVK